MLLSADKAIQKVRGQKGRYFKIYLKSDTLGVLLALWVEHETLELQVMSSRPMLGIESISKKI